MTDEKSLDNIKMLLLKYPGVTFAGVFGVPNRHEVYIRFRCNHVDSLKAIAVASFWANVRVTLSNPTMNISAEPEGISDLPCEVRIPDNETLIPTHPQRFGVYLSADLASRGLMSKVLVKELHAGWNTDSSHFI